MRYADAPVAFRLERPAGSREFASWIAGLPATAYCASRRPLRTGLSWDEV